MSERLKEFKDMWKANHRSDSRTEVVNASDIEFLIEKAEQSFNHSEINKRLGVAEYLHSTINSEIEFLQEQINLLNERLVLKRSHLADAQYEVTRIVKEKQTAERFAKVEGGEG